MSLANDLKIRTMRREEPAFAIDLAAAEGWNPGIHDAECFFSADPGGFLIGLDGPVIARRLYEAASKLFGVTTFELG